jgi:hypothetical protein
MRLLLCRYLTLRGWRITDVPTTSTASDGEVRPAYINFREVFAREWIDSALDQLRSYLGQEDQSRPNAELGINALLRENFLDDAGMFDVDPSLFFVPLSAAAGTTMVGG